MVVAMQFETKKKTIFEACVERNKKIEKCIFCCVLSCVISRILSCLRCVLAYSVLYCGVVSCLACCSVA
jgi:hypothetical protein